MVYTCANCGIIRGGGAPLRMLDQCRCGATDVTGVPCVEGPRGSEGSPGSLDHPKKVYRGFLKFGSNGEEDEILFLSKSIEEEGQILAETVRDDIRLHGNWLSVRYFIADEEMSIDDLTQSLIKKVCGESEVRYRMKYSEITGYLWTDEDLKVGGHDLLQELKREKGRFCHLEIEFAGGPKRD